MQIAEALAIAHAAGIVHRDLKPANIMVDKSGLIKVLDFGLAKLAAPAFTSGSADVTPAMATIGTTPGMIVGTVAYMSPEQARGRELDGRSDLFSFGSVLYQMATGMAPFRGESAAVIFDAILNKTPSSVRERNPEIPVELERVITRLLEKDQETRYQSALDVRADLKRGDRDSSAAGAVAPESNPRALTAYAIAAAVTIALLAGGAFWWQRARSRPLTDQDVLVMADFTNATGDTAFDGALRQALAFELEKSPFLKIMDDREVNQTLQLMRRPAGQRITYDIANEVCVREGQKATLDGSIVSFGKTYQIVLQVINCQTGATLAREQAEAEDKEHVLKALAKAATGIRHKLGESLSTIQKPERYVIDLSLTTTSLEALKSYQLGGNLISQGFLPEAIPELQRAIELDPNFASAYYLLSIVYINSGDDVRQRESISKAFALADHVSEDERLLISGDYYQFVTHDLGKAIDAYQVEARTYPRNAAPHNSLSLLYDSKGELEKALPEAQEALRLAPGVGPFVGVVMGLYIGLDRFDQAKSYAEKAFSRNVAVPMLHNLLLRIAFIQDDHSAQDHEIQWLAGRPEEVQSLQDQADNAIMHGQRRKANELSQRVSEVARRQGLTGVQGDTPAAVDALMGDCQAARQGELSLAWLCGDAAAMRLVVEHLAKNPSPDPDRADLVYLRGLAGLRAGKGAEAAAEFRKILDHKGRNWGPLYSPLGCLGLARAEVLAGDPATAKKAYEDFFARWKDADPDMPTLIAARKEYAALK